MTVFLKKYLLILGCFAFTNQLPGQVMGIRHYKIEDGSRQIKIFTLFKNSQGYIYAGTSDGLYKFDGIKFTVVPFQNPGSEPVITCIFQDAEKQLWVGMQSGNIGRLVNGVLKLYNPEKGTPKKPITSFLQDKHGNIWFATDGEGIYYGYNNHLYNINIEDGLAENNVYAMALADNGEVLAGTDQGLSICRVSGVNKKITNINSTRGLPDNYVKLITPAGNNNFWIGMQDKGICLFNNSSKQFSIPGQIGKWKYGQVNGLLQSQNNLWIATEDQGLFIQPNTAQTLQAVKIDNDEHITLNGILEDNEGNVWLLKNNNELIKTAGEQLKLVIPYKEKEFEKVHALLCDNKNNIWTGTDGGVIKYMVNNGNEKAQKFNIRELDKKTAINALYQDTSGYIWIGTSGKGIFLMDENSGSYRKINENKLLDNSSVLSITGRGTSVFVSSLEGAVAFIISGNRSINTWLDYTDFSNITGIGRIYIYDIFKDSRNRIWFATFGRGVTVLDNGSFTNYDETYGIKDKFVYSVAEDIKGNIWFSTRSAGIYKFDGKKFDNYTISNGLSDIDLSAIKTDRDGNVLIVYKKGIDLLNAQTAQLSHINASQGISDVNVQDLATVAQDTSGAILVSTTDGIVSYHPQPRTIHQPQTILESVKLFFTGLDDTSKNKFDYNENGFSFSFTGLYYTDPEAVHYKYKLDGYNSIWVSTKDRTVPFPKLSPGKYKFRVRSSINQVFDDSNEATYEFIVEKPLWTRWWFIILCLLIVACLLYWYVKLREKNVKKVERLQHEKMQFQFETLRNQVNPHFLFNSFNTLISIIEENPKMAVEYVEQLSAFFRNIVNYRDKDIITLKEEIGLLKTYLFIQQKRFGQNLRLNINLNNEEKEQTFIPPLTLQLLAENAIKHNAVSKETPLNIDIFTEQGRLVFRNNLNPKLTASNGAGMGLQNITNRYKLLSEKEVSILNNNKYFSVSLPTLKQ
jgi:ligand-binding sensor domain-containing protein